MAGVFAELFVRGGLVVADDPAATARNIEVHGSIYHCGYVAELIQVRVDCAKSRFSRLRDMELDAGGEVLADDAEATAFQPFPSADNIGDMPRDAAVVEAEEGACYSGDSGRFQGGSSVLRRPAPVTLYPVSPLEPLSV